MRHRIRDPVHNFIAFTDQELRLINAPVLQRLRGIRQLALASLVYPGALHTRFDHTLGVTHVAGLMSKELGLDPDDTTLIRLACLLHDVGHGPFSHVSENALDLYGDRTKLGEAQKREKIHELVTASIIRNDEVIKRCIGQDLCDHIVKLLSDGWGKKTLRDIVSGPLDADKQDYLLRDSRFSGVEYGTFDLHQLHRSLRQYRYEGEEQLVVRHGALHAVEQFVLAKYYMTFDVYRHKVRITTDQMIVRAIVLGIDIDENETLRSLYSFDNSPEFVERYSSWDDARFMESFGRGGVGKCGGMIQRLRERRLLKRVLHLRLDSRDLSAEAREWVSTISEPHRKDDRRRVESAAAEAIRRADVPLDDDENFVIVHAYSIKSARVMARNDEADILVQTDSGIVPFPDESTLFRSIGKKYNDAFVDVFAPVQWQNPEERARVIGRLREPLVKAMESQCGLFAEEEAKK